MLHVSHIPTPHSSSSPCSSRAPHMDEARKPDERLSRRPQLEEEVERTKSPGDRQ